MQRVNSCVTRSHGSGSVGKHVLSMTKAGQGASPALLKNLLKKKKKKKYELCKQSARQWETIPANGRGIVGKASRAGLLLWPCVLRPGLCEMAKVQNLRRHSLLDSHFVILAKRECTLKFCSWNTFLPLLFPSLFARSPYQAKKWLFSYLCRCLVPLPNLKAGSWLTLR